MIQIIVKFPSDYLLFFWCRHTIFIYLIQFAVFLFIPCTASINLANLRFSCADILFPVKCLLLQHFIAFYSIDNNNNTKKKVFVDFFGAERRVNMIRYIMLKKNSYGKVITTPTAKRTPKNCLIKKSLSLDRTIKGT